MERITPMQTLLQAHHLSTHIMAASIKSTAEAESALMADAHDLTIAPGVLLELIRNEQSEEAIQRFSMDWQKMKTL